MLYASAIDGECMKITRNFFLGACCITASFLLVTYLGLYGLLYSFDGNIVADAFSLEQSLKFYNLYDGGLAALSEVYTKAKSFFGVSLIYYWSSTKIGLYTDTLTNLVLTITTWRYTCELAKVYNANNSMVLCNAIIFWFINPYYLAILFYPNKEIPLLLLTVAFVYKVINRNFLTAFLIIWFTYYIRDGYAIVLLTTYCIFMLVMHFKIHPKWVVFVVIAILYMFQNGGLSSLGGAFERNAYIGTLYGQHGASNLAIFIQKFIGNWLNLGLRSQFMSVTGIYLLNIGLWLLGIMVAIALPLSVYYFVKFDEKMFLLNCLVLGMITALLYSSYIQPRYFFPLIPIFLIITSKIHPLIFLILSTITLLLNPFLFHFDLLPPLQEGIPNSAMRSF